MPTVQDAHNGTPWLSTNLTATGVTVPAGPYPGIIPYKTNQHTDMATFNTSTSAAEKAEKFKEDVWKSTADFQDLIGKNRVMMFSATHCSYCKTAKVRTEHIH